MKELYLKILNDELILKIYEDIKEMEDETNGWSYHSFDHIMNVTKTCETLLKALNYDDEFIEKSKIACLLHDTGALQGKENHALRSYEFALKYFDNNKINFEDKEKVLEAIKIHSDGFDTDNIIALTLILADKLDVKKNRIAKEGMKIIGNRQYSHIEDINVKIENNCLKIDFLTDNNLNFKEFNDYYFTKKILKSIEAFSKKLNLRYEVSIDNKDWKHN